MAIPNTGGLRVKAQHSFPPSSGCIDRSTALRQFLKWTVSGICAFTAARYRAGHLWEHGTLLSRCAALLLWVLTAYCVHRILGLLSRWLHSQQATIVQAGFTAKQRTLLGLPLPPPPAPLPQSLRHRRPIVQPPPPLPQTIATPQRALPPKSPLMSTPLSYGRGADGMGADHHAIRTPLTGSTGMSRPSPQSAYSAPNTVSTPGQLQYYLDSFTRDIQPPAPQAPMGDGFQQPFTHFANYGGADAEPSVSPRLPLGADAPKYHSSWVAKKGVAHPADVLSVSGEGEVEDFCATVLLMQRAWLGVWTERLREWLAERVLQPLVRQIETAHVAANEILQRYGVSGAGVLPALPSVVDASGTTDIEALLRHLTSWTRQQLYQANSQRGVDAVRLDEELQRYERLWQQLRGKRPSDLLPPAPAGYLWSRLQALAGGTCVPEFRWNGGGTWMGRAWSPDLPNDGALLLYLFTAFLMALGQTGDGEVARGMPLFLGALKTRPPNQYTAVLAYRPEAKPGRDVDAVLALNQGSASPMFCVQAEGRMVVLSGHNAVFHAILMMLQFHKLRYRGLVGELYLSDEVLALAPVIERPVGSAVSALRQVIFGVFFPPSSLHSANE